MATGSSLTVRGTGPAASVTVRPVRVVATVSVLAMTMGSVSSGAPAATSAAGIFNVTSRDTLAGLGVHGGRG